MSYYSKDDRFYMDFMDEDGNKITFEIITEIFLDGNKYLILGDDSQNNEDSYVVREDFSDQGVEYNFLDNEEEFSRVKKEYKKIIYG
ncbi:hypothetical protein SFBM_0336 [Candidatus Arthromitus sp. SFB-mouse-Japan]|uniref:DUF1292 domain-containing protein n=1 Tax=Candidatus Arthromitus sp. SFB-mouse TaxID=49118 RepID=UPI00021B7DC0|nr:DUF1292 domain-containing protein [Candidatus Arthromitus sp. SFB-mouse]EIA26149.1 hypothetical protein SFB3_044G1 [Candidatus Arthromitus sp. SFB-3]EIA26165.1 hypothetical protein SFB5_288G2 [Candidatus Arthromitus sp. SFB-5]EIA29157.1 hypothetical protein SFB6_014G17 [Candidatus Arthromitus sp. SFB-co]EIA29648.1 hypothetical protein SFB4_050G3 [Candidatus Arthromitus sp. SFB-4]EIA30382.1 hypothetical protein SFBSU_006G63 [Candidatus Arthromitus sp. SFB-mouse-SU]